MLPRRNVAITWFVILWTLIFHYETLRANYLRPLLGRELPKLPLLFPFAGWVMFFHIDTSYGFAEVYGNARSGPVPLDPHDILPTKAVGYDNIHRNVLIGALSRQDAPSFCRYLHRKFPVYDSFTVVYGNYPDVVEAPEDISYTIAYQCP